VKTFSGKIPHPDIDRNAYQFRSASATADVLSKTLQVEMRQRGAIVRAAQTYLSDAGYYRTSLIVCTSERVQWRFLELEFLHHGHESLGTWFDAERWCSGARPRIELFT
jgi:hypothetical protein